MKKTQRINNFSSKTKKEAIQPWIASNGIRRRPTLPGRVQPSTIGAEGLNFCVRYGNRWNPFAIATGNCINFIAWPSLSLAHARFPCLIGRFRVTNLSVCFLLMGPRSVILHSSYLPKVLFCPLEVFLFPEAFAPAFRAAHPFS